MISLIALFVGCAIGFVAGTRTHRRRMQTSWGRHRTGAARVPAPVPVAAAMDAEHPPTDFDDDPAPATTVLPLPPETTAIPLLDGSLPARPRPVRLGPSHVPGTDW